jgi:hypothetical protein
LEKIQKMIQNAPGVDHVVAKKFKSDPDLRSERRTFEPQLAAWREELKVLRSIIYTEKEIPESNEDVIEMLKAREKTTEALVLSHEGKNFIDNPAEEDSWVYWARANALDVTSDIYRKLKVWEADRELRRITYLGAVKETNVALVSIRNYIAVLEKDRSTAPPPSPENMDERREAALTFQERNKKHRSRFLKASLRRARQKMKAP